MMMMIIPLTDVPGVRQEWVSAATLSLASVVRPRTTTRRHCPSSGRWDTTWASCLPTAWGRWGHHPHLICIDPAVLPRLQCWPPPCRWCPLVTENTGLPPTGGQCPTGCEAAPPAGLHHRLQTRGCKTQCCPRGQHATRPGGGSEYYAAPTKYCQ